VAWQVPDTEKVFPFSYGWRVAHGKYYPLLGPKYRLLIGEINPQPGAPPVKHRYGNYRAVVAIGYGQQHRALVTRCYGLFVKTNCLLNKKLFHGCSEQASGRRQTESEAVDNTRQHKSARDSSNTLEIGTCNVVSFTNYYLHLFFMSGSATISLRQQLCAWWLLLLLARVLTPEAAMLHLHAHAHTGAEPAFAKQARAKAKTLLTTKHQHCHTEQLYQLPFAPAALVELPVLVRQLAYATYRPQAPVCRQAHLLDGACLRGPPVLS
jgi:hypothetical protein